MHKILKLQHHRHSLKLLSHEHTSFRSLAVLLLLTGGVLIGLHASLLDRARAADYVVTATVPMFAPSTPPTITSIPTTTATASVSLSGTCPVTIPALSVVIYRGTTIIGSTPCEFDGTYQLSAPLTSGANQLVARGMTITNHTTPASNAVSITYNPPSPPPPVIEPVVPVAPGPIDESSEPPADETPQPEPAKPATTGPPPAIIVETPIIIYGPNKEAVWRGTLEGGSPPYTLTIDWGDGNKTVLKDLYPGEHEARHIYTELRSYKVQLVAKDENGTTVLGVFAALTPYVDDESQGGATIGSGDITFPLIGLYLAYISTLGLFGYFWKQYHGQFAYAGIKQPVKRTYATKQRKQRKKR